MANSTLEFIITAKDEASAKLQALSKNIEGITPGLQAIGGAATVAFATITAVAATSIKAAEESQKVQAQLGAVLKSTGGIAGVTAEKAIELSKALESTTTFSDEAVLSAENLLLTFTKIGKDTMPQATQTVLDMATALGEDTKSAAIQLGKALQDPILGVTALRRVGVNFSQDQIAVIKNLVDTGRAAEAQQFILKELSTEFGGSASAAAKTFGGNMQQMTNRIDDLQEEIGNALIPMLVQLLEKINPIITAVTQWITEHPTLVKWIIILGGALSGTVAIASGLALLLPTLIAGFTLLAGPIGLVIAIIVVLSATIGALIKIFFLLRDNSTEIWAGLKIMFKESIDAIVGFFQPLMDIIDSLINKLASVGQAVGNVLNKAGGVVSNAVNGAVNAVTGKRASGGGVRSGDTYLVGENGPELFSPSSSGYITGNSRLAGAGGGNITVNITGTFMSENAATLVGNMIVKKFKKMSRTGLY